MTNSYNDIRNAKTHDHHRRQPGRGAPGLDAAPAAAQGDQPRQHDRRRSALHAHGRARDRVRAASAPAPTFRSSGACSGTSSRTAGRTRNSSPSASTAWTRSARRSPSGRPTRSSASPACRASSSSASPRNSRRRSRRRSSGAWAQTQHTVGTANVRASCILQLAIGNVGVARRRRQHLPRPHQRAGRDRPRARYHHAAALLRPRRGRLEALGARLGGRLRVAAEPVRRGAGEGRPQGPHRKENMETPGITSTRWFDAVNCPRSRSTSAAPFAAMIVMGHGGNTVTRIPEAKKGMEKLDLLVVADPHPTTFAALSDRARRHLPAADLHLARMRRLAHGLEPLAAVGREDRRADLRVEGRLRDHVPAREEARLRRADVQEHQGRRHEAGAPRTSCARSTAAAGPPAMRASRRSA